MISLKSLDLLGNFLTDVVIQISFSIHLRFTVFPDDVDKSITLIFYLKFGLL